jgi:hypothetical protein
MEGEAVAAAAFLPLLLPQSREARRHVMPNSFQHPFRRQRDPFQMDPETSSE